MTMHPPRRFRLMPHASAWRRGLADVIRLTTPARPNPIDNRTIMRLLAFCLASLILSATLIPNTATGRDRPRLSCHRELVSGCQDGRPVLP